jgi:hypothetical protein
MFSRAQTLSVVDRALGLIGSALTLVFLILLMRDLRRLLDNQRLPAAPSPVE